MPAYTGKPLKGSIVATVFSYPNLDGSVFFGQSGSRLKKHGSGSVFNQPIIIFLNRFWRNLTKKDSVTVESVKYDIK